MEWMQVIVPVLTGLAATIPLVIKLVEYVQKAMKEKNWNKLLDLLMGYMERAEEMFDNGADRKEWVMAMIKSSADTIDFEIDMRIVSELIDGLCSMSKTVNAREVSIESLIQAGAEHAVAEG